MVVSGSHHRIKPAPFLAALALGVGAWGQAPSTAAQVAAAQGRVSVLKHGESWALFTGNSVRVGEIIETGLDGYAQLRLSDGSSFEVFPNSRVVFRANPGNLRELVEIYLGRIKVYIQHFGGRPNPYRVHSPTAVISVRGTVFDVDVEPDTTTWIGVTEGLVEVVHRLLPGGRPIAVAPGQEVRVFPNAPLAQSGVNKMGVVAKVAGAVRDIIYSLPRTSSGSGGAASGGGAGAPIPTDTSAPAPPPPPTPTDREAPPPPPPPQ